MFAASPCPRSLCPVPLDLMAEYADHLLVEHLQRARARTALAQGRPNEAAQREERAGGLSVDAGWLSVDAGWLSVLAARGTC